MGIKGRGRSGVSIPVNGNALSQKPTQAVADGNTLIYGLLKPRLHRRLWMIDGKSFTAR
jgi:hypothetical protein